jgi:hypothetical protein
VVSVVDNAVDAVVSVAVLAAADTTKMPDPTGVFALCKNVCVGSVSPKNVIV